MEEIWKDIPGYEGYYQVSDLGRVKSLERETLYSNGRRASWKERIMKTPPSKRGYPRLNLSKDGKCKMHKVHQIVAMAFLDHVPNGGYNVVVDHKDNNPLNNKLSNLQLISQRLNSSKDKRGRSKHTGLWWDENRKRWRASIRINGKTTFIGRFKTEEEAAKAYRDKLKEITK